MPEEIVWTWNDKQSAFITTPKRYAAYVGSFGCGKTSAFCRRSVAIAQKYPGSRILLARYTFPEVESTLVPQFMETCPQAIIKKWHKSSLTLELYCPKGGTSVIVFRNLEDPKKFRSENLSAFGISQADDAGITVEHWDELTHRLRRAKGPYGPIPRQYGFLEANYRGHNWVWQIFTDEGQRTSGRVRADGTPYVKESGEAVFDPEKYFIIEGETRDNEANLPQEYMESMEAMPEEWKKRYFFGSWDEMGGLVYEEFGQNNLSAGVSVGGQWQDRIPDFWHRYRTVDHGTRAVTCCLWAAVSPGGTVYIYDEYYRPGRAMDHAKKIRERHAIWNERTQSWVPTEKYQWTVIDRSSFNTEGTSGESAADQYFEQGVPVVKAPAGERDVGSGVAVVKKYLSTIDRETGRPKLQIIHRKCPNLVREIKEYVWDELGPTRRAKRNEPERPRKLRDHAMDALRYLLVSRPQPSPEMVVNREEKEDMIRGMSRKEAYQHLWEP